MNKLKNTSNMENYEEKYKKALGWMRSIYPTMQGVDKEDAEHYFPELCELEDERIRKEIIQSIQDNMCVIHKDKCIAWLEKQGEQKTEIEYIYPKFRIGDVIEPIKPNGNSKPVRVLSISKKFQSYCCESDDHNVYSSIPIRCENEYKLVEQKPIEQDTENHDLWVYIREWHDKFGRLPIDEDELEACIDYVMKRQKTADKIEQKYSWSEEDEKFVVDTMNFLYRAKNQYAQTARLEECIDWLKSIKPNHWKPSDEQMQALKYFISFHEDHARSLTTKWEEFKNLKSLYNDLKKL